METHDALKASSSQLLVRSRIDPRDEWEEKVEKAEKALTRVLEDEGNSSSSSPDKDLLEALVAQASKSPQNHEELCLAYLHRILQAGGSFASGPKPCPQLLKTLVHVSRDNLKSAVERVNALVTERYPRLSETSRVQILWFLREIVKTGVPMADMICFSLMRQIAGGCLDPRNVWLAESLLAVFVDHKAWFFGLPVLVQSAVFLYLRLIVDHQIPRLSTLRDREVEFCVEILREKFDLCLGIGRDLVRLLQGVARIPAFSALWTDILHNPSALSSSFAGGLPQVMRTRTRRLFLQSRLTPDMERKINFLVSSVKFGQQRRHQEWFQKSYLSLPESQSLRCDLIRYVCCVTQQNIQGVPRWAVIRWLLTTCTSNVDASNAKLALFYDWLFYDPGTDNIMNVEPAVLVMFHSIRQNLSITATLLDFLCRMVNHFSIPHRDAVRSGVLAALKEILSFRVVPSLSPFFSNPNLDIELRQMMRENFPSLAPPPEQIVEDRNGVKSVEEAATPTEVAEETPPAADNGASSDVAEGVFSDDEEEAEEEESTIPEPKSTELSKKPLSSKLRPNFESLDAKLRGLPSRVRTIADLEAALDKIPSGERLKEVVLAYQRARIDASAKERTDRMLRTLEECLETMTTTSEAEFAATTTKIAEVVCYVLWNKSQEFEEERRRVFEDGVNADTVRDLTEESPSFVVLKSLRDAEEGEKTKGALKSLVKRMSDFLPRFGYLYLLLLSVGETLDGGSVEEDSSSMFLCYAEFAALFSASSKSDGVASPTKTPESRILCRLKRDLRICAGEDPTLLCHLLPHLFKHFRRLCLGNSQILRLIVSSVNAVQLQDVVTRILLGHLILLPLDSGGDGEESPLLKMAKKSLEWETIEQIFLWQLINAHSSVTTESLLPLLPHLDFRLHFEALTSLALLLKREAPTSELLRHLLNKECVEGDCFVIGVLRHWVQRQEEKLASLMQAQIHRSSSSSKKRSTSTRPSSKPSLPIDPPMSLILAHLEHLRKTCTSNLNTFFFRDSMQIALTEMQNFCSESQKLRYSDLLSLAEELDDDDAKFQRNLRHHGRRGNASPAAAAATSFFGPSGGEKSSSGESGSLSMASFSSATAAAASNSEKRSFSSSHNGSRKHPNKSLSLDDAIRNKVCLFCGLGDAPSAAAPSSSSKKSPLNSCGELHASDRCFAHYRCMQYNSRLWQYDDDAMGFGGFSVDAVVAAFHETKNYPCAACLPYKGKPPLANRVCPNPRGASAGCAIRACRKAYHFPCAPLYKEIARKTSGGKVVYHFRTWCSQKHKEADLKRFEKEAEKEVDELVYEDDDALAKSKADDDDDDDAMDSSNDDDVDDDDDDDGVFHNKESSDSSSDE